MSNLKPPSINGGTTQRNGVSGIAPAGGGSDTGKRCLPPKPPSAEEARERGRLGGIKSGESRRRRKALREAMQAILTGTYDLPGGQTATGAEAIAQRLMEVMLDASTEPKVFLACIQEVERLTGADISEEERERMLAEVALLKAKAKATGESW